MSENADGVLGVDGGVDPAGDAGDGDDQVLLDELTAAAEAEEASTEFQFRSIVDGSFPRMPEPHTVGPTLPQDTDAEELLDQLAAGIAQQVVDMVFPADGPGTDTADDSERLFREQLGKYRMPGTP
jgi:hypothetical protein